jgi:iron complex outermembrane receptor protein
VELQTSTLLSGSELADPRRELNLLAPLVASAGARLVETARLRYRLNDAIAIAASAGQELEQLGLDEPGTPLLRARRAASRLSAGVVADIARALELNALAALEYHATSAAGDGSAASTAAAEPTARAGARLRLADGVDLLANVGRYARVPTLGELYGTSAVVRGNADLAPERGYLADVGARAALDLHGVSLDADVFAFARVASDLIAFRQSNLGIIRPYNLASARVLGVEVAARARFLGHLSVELALTATDPRDTSPGQTTANDLLPYHARLVAVPSLEVHGGPLPAIRLDRAALRARLSYRSPYAADPAGSVVIHMEAPLDLEGVLSFLQGRVAARVAVTDVFDTARLDVVGLPLPRRAAHASLEVWW